MYESGHYYNRVASTMYVAVTDGGADDAIEVPTEPDGTLLLSTLVAQFPSATGLKYKPDGSRVFRGLRCDEKNKIHAPEEGWGSDPMIIVYPKENAKRKNEDSDGGLAGASAKLKKLDRKCSDLVVLGLPHSLKVDELRDYFDQFGEMVMCEIKKDSNGNSKGFAFLRFSDIEAQQEALSRKHQIGERLCECKIPNSQLGKNPATSNRVFVGRVPEQMGAPDIRSGFEDYGKVADVYIPKPHRGFAFVTFADPHVASKLVDSDIIVDGHSLHIGPAAPKEMAPKSKQPNNMGPGMGMGFGGMGMGGSYGGPMGPPRRGGGGGGLLQHPSGGPPGSDYYGGSGMGMGGAGPMGNGGGGGGAKSRNDLAKGIDQLNLEASSSIAFHAAALIKSLSSSGAAPGAVADLLKDVGAAATGATGGPSGGGGGIKRDRSGGFPNRSNQKQQHHQYGGSPDNGYGGGASSSQYPGSASYDYFQAPSYNYDNRTSYW